MFILFYPEVSLHSWLLWPMVWHPRHPRHPQGRQACHILYFTWYLRLTFRWHQVLWQDIHNYCNVSLVSPKPRNRTIWRVFWTLPQSPVIDETHLMQIRGLVLVYKLSFLCPHPNIYKSAKLKPNSVLQSGLKELRLRWPPTMILYIVWYYDRGIVNAVQDIYCIELKVLMFEISRKIPADKSSVIINVLIDNISVIQFGISRIYFGYINMK